MKKIEDYIHMYIGSDIMCYNIKYKLKGVCSRVDGEDGLRIQMRVFEVGTGNRTLWADHDEVKLLLRPLSSMTEDEAKKFLEIDGIDAGGSFVKVTGSGIMHGFNLWEFDAGKGMPANPHQFAYLLSKSFDLFGLIDSGLAIDATKLEGYGK